MNASHSVETLLQEEIEKRSVLALATVVESWGSAPCPVGSQMLIRSDGHFAGSVSGGCLEGHVISSARKMIAAGEKPQLLNFDISNDDAWSVGLPCGGALKILIQRLDTSVQQVHSALASHLAGLKARRVCAFVTDISNGQVQSLEKGGGRSGWRLPISDEAIFASATPHFLKSDSGNYFVNIHRPPLRLILIGAVHIAQALAVMAQPLGYETIIIDPRRGFLTEERFPAGQRLNMWPDEAFALLGLDAATAVVTLSHDRKIDLPALEQALTSDVLYIGALGSRKTQAERQAYLQTRGYSPRTCARIHGPVGLRIGAQGAAEIAVSILAEIVSIHRPSPPIHFSADTILEPEAHQATV